MEDARLERIERKLDEVAQALNTLARIEERMGTQNKGLERLGRRVDDQGARIRELELKLANTQPKSEMNEWAIRLMMGGIFSGFIGLVVYLVK